MASFNLVWPAVLGRSAALIAVGIGLGFSTPANATTPCFAEVRPTRDGVLALRAEPTTRAALLARIPSGDAVRLLERDGGADGADLWRDRTRRWIKVEWEGKTGWVYSRLLDEPLCG